MDLFCSDAKLNSVKVAVNWPRANTRMGEMLRYMTGTANFEVLGYHSQPKTGCAEQDTGRKIHNADRVLMQASLHSSCHSRFNSA